MPRRHLARPPEIDRQRRISSTAGRSGQPGLVLACFFKRTIELTNRTHRIILTVSSAWSGDRGDLSEQLAPRHQTLKRHDAVVGSIDRRRT